MSTSPALAKVSEHIYRDGFAVLDSFLPLTLVEECANVVASLLPASYDDIVKRSNRGPMRYYFDLKPSRAFLQVMGHLGLVAILHSVLGDDVVAYQLAVDTPYFGSTFQEFHPDGMRPLDFGAEPLDTRSPTFLSVNFPLVDINDTNGPFEVIPGTHHLPVAEADKLLESGALHSQRLHMRRGDVLIRDLRTLHRGSPNLCGTPRPMAVWGFAADADVVWGRLRNIDRPVLGPEVLIGGVQFDNEPLSWFDLRSLSEFQQHMLRIWPVVGEGQE